jgi:hypothetical protein
MQWLLKSVPFVAVPNFPILNNNQIIYIIIL